MIFWRMKRECVLLYRKYGKNVIQNEQKAKHHVHMRVCHSVPSRHHTHFDAWFDSLLFPRIIRIWVSRAKWSLSGCGAKMALGASKWSSKFGKLVSLIGDSGGVAYNGDIQPISERSMSKKNEKQLQVYSWNWFNKQKLFINHTEIKFLLFSFIENVRMAADWRSEITRHWLHMLRRWVRYLTVFICRWWHRNHL